MTKETICFRILYSLYTRGCRFVNTTRAVSRRRSPRIFYFLNIWYIVQSVVRVTGQVGLCRPTSQHLHRGIVIPIITTVHNITLYTLLHTLSHSHTHSMYHCTYICILYTITNASVSAYTSYVMCVTVR